MLYISIAIYLIIAVPLSVVMWSAIATAKLADGEMETYLDY